MKVNWKKIITITLDVILGGYIIVAFTAMDKPREEVAVCSKVNIHISDETTNGFITEKEIRQRLVETHLYPAHKPLRLIDCRSIEQTLKTSAFVKTAECYKTQDGQVDITITQRMPIVRIKAANGQDYYLDDNNHVMPNSKYTSDLIIATGAINQWFACNYISNLSKALMESNLWRNQIEQINVLPDHSIELVPRVGDHIIYLGQMPNIADYRLRQDSVFRFVQKKMDRLEKFYKYGLSQAGWNKYSYINLEFDNQIICKRRDKTSTIE